MAEKKKGVFGKIVKILLFAVLLAACIVAGFIIGDVVYKHGESTVVVVDFGFNDIGELATEEYYFTDVKDFSDSKMVGSVKIPFTTKKLICSYSGTIKAGIDFAQIKVDVIETDKAIMINMPQVRILSCELDNESFQVLDEKSSIFNQIKAEDINALQQEMKDTMQQKAIDKGLLDKAQVQAEMLVKNMILGLGKFSDYSLRFRW